MKYGIVYCRGLNWRVKGKEYDNNDVDLIEESSDDEDEGESDQYYRDYLHSLALQFDDILKRVNIGEHDEQNEVPNYTNNAMTWKTDSVSHPDSASDLEAVDTPFPAQSPKSRWGDKGLLTKANAILDDEGDTDGEQNSTDTPHHDDIVTITHPKRDKEFTSTANEISDDEGETNNEQTTTDIPKGTAKQHRKRAHIDIPWPLAREKILHNARRKKCKKRPGPTKLYNERTRHNTKGNLDRMEDGKTIITALQHTEEMKWSTKQYKYQMGHPTTQSSPKGNFGRMEGKNEKLKGGTGRSRTCYPHPPPKYTIERVGKRLRIMNNVEHPVRKRYLDRADRSPHFAIDKLELMSNRFNVGRQIHPSLTGNLGRAGTDQSSSKGNLGRMGCRMAENQLELIVWQLRKKGIAIN